MRGNGNLRASPAAIFRWTCIAAFLLFVWNPANAIAGDEETVVQHVGQFARLARALQRYERALEIALNKGMSGISRDSATRFGNELHRMRVDAWKSLADNPNSPIRRVGQTFHGEKGRHVFRIDGDDRWEFWIEKTIPRPGGNTRKFRADTVIVDLHNKEIWVEDVTARSINDPDLGKPGVYDRDRGATAAHWVHNHERAQALQDRLGSEWKVTAHTPEEAHYRTMAMRNIRERQTRALTVDVQRRNGPSRMHGFVGGVMINYLISKFLQDETSPNRNVEILSGMYKAYIAGDLGRAHALHHRWDSGADGALFFKQLVGDEAVALTLFESTNELVKMIDVRIRADQRPVIEGIWWNEGSSYALSEDAERFVTANYEAVSPELAENYGYENGRLAWRGRKLEDKIAGRADPASAPTREGMRNRYPLRFRELCRDKWEKYVGFELTIVSADLLFGFRPAYRIDASCRETEQGIVPLIFTKRETPDNEESGGETEEDGQ